MDPTLLGWLVLGLLLLSAGAELLVAGAARLAGVLGISPLVIGLTVVAFGTSAPELAVSLRSGFADQAGIAVGNVVGSNIFNILVILGLSALVTPLVVAQQLVRLDVPVMIAVTGMVWLLGADGAVGRLDGILLVGILVAYLVFLVRQSRKEPLAVRAEYDQEFGAHEARTRSRSPVDVLRIAAGLAMLVVGARWLVDGAGGIARALGVSELIIGLTVVAAGTSLPEAATSVVAALRGERDIAVGNAVGSNIFNLLAVLGTAAVLTPKGIAVSEAALRFDIPVMTAVAVACLPVFFTGNLIARWEGALFLGYYAAYIAYLVLDALGHRLLPLFSTAMLVFVLPLTAITLALVSWRAYRARRRSPEPEG